MTSEKNNNKTVLIVDDEEEICRLFTRVLQNAGYKSLSASDGMEALVKAQDNNIDLVITDIRMPGISGLDLIRQLHDLEPQLPIIVISGFGGQAAAVESLERGAFFFLQKPFEASTLLNIVKKGMRLPHITNHTYAEVSNTVHNINFSFLPDFNILEGINSQVSAAARYMGYSLPLYSMILPFVINELLEKAIIVGKKESNDKEILLGAEISLDKITITINTSAKTFSPDEIPESFDDIDISDTKEMGMMMVRRYSDVLEFSDNGKNLTVIINKTSDGDTLNDESASIDN